MTALQLMYQISRLGCVREGWGGKINFTLSTGGSSTLVIHYDFAKKHKYALWDDGMILSFYGGSSTVKASLHHSCFLSNNLLDLLQVVVDNAEGPISNMDVWSRECK